MLAAMIIRKFCQADAINVSNVIRRSLALLNSKDYSDENIKFMVEHFSPQTVLDLAAKREMFIAVVDSKIAGTGSLQNGTIYSLFVDPDYVGKGIGTKLMNKLEETAKSNHIDVLKVPSSITAIGFYMRLGFVKEKEVFSKKSGLTIHMTKKL